MLTCRKILQFIKEERKLCSGPEYSSERLLYWRLSHSRSLRLLPKELGRKPENELWPISKALSVEALVMQLGSLPLSLFRARDITVSFGSLYSELEGRCPESLFNCNAIKSMVDILNIFDGIDPVKLFPP